MAAVPLGDIPARFESALLYSEDFIVVMRPGHPFLSAPNLDSYCRTRHLVVSLTGDSFGFVDQVLAGHGRARSVALTVPNFMMALATIAETELITAVPRRFAAMHAGRYGLAIAEPPLTLPRFSIRLVASKAAMMDAGVNWMFETLLSASRT